MSLPDLVNPVQHGQLLLGAVGDALKRRRSAGCRLRSYVRRRRPPRSGLVEADVGAAPALREGNVGAPPADAKGNGDLE